MIANYHSIETFSSLDGPGIRYVLFLQGCNFNCKFCHNVDTVPMISNKQITVNEVVKDYLKYISFYRKGGITISGGEPLLQIDFIFELFKKLKEHGVHTCIETQGSLFKNTAKYRELISVTDLFLVDVKGVDDQHAIDICGKDMKKTFEFLDFLDKNGSAFTVTYVLLPGLNDDDYCVEQLARLLNQYHGDNRNLKVLPYRRLGVEKWKSLNLEYELEDLLEPTKEEASLFSKKVKIEMLRQIALEP